MQNNKIDKELYWRFAKFEIGLKTGMLEILYKISDNFLDLQYAGIPIWWYDHNKQEYLEFCDEFGIIPNIEEFEENIGKPQGVIKEFVLEVDNDIRTKNDISHDERVSKLSLGFFIKLTKWENIKIICDAIEKKQFADNKLPINWFHEFNFLDILFHHEKWRVYNIDWYMKNDELYEDLCIIQNLRNDFCHFRFPPEKLEETKTLLDKYIFLMEKPKNIKQKEQHNHTSDKFIKNIQADNVELKDTDFEKNIEKVALSKVKK